MYTRPHDTHIHFLPVIIYGHLTRTTERIDARTDGTSGASLPHLQAVLKRTEDEEEWITEPSFCVLCFVSSVLLLRKCKQSSY